MFDIPFLKRIKQLLCKHNFFAVAVTHHYKEPASTISQTASIYKCEHCELPFISKKEK